MPAPHRRLGLRARALLPACDSRPATTGPVQPTAAERTTVANTTAPTAGTSTVTTTGAADTQTVGHVRVAIKKVSVGKVPLEAADGSITHAGERRLV